MSSKAALCVPMRPGLAESSGECGFPTMVVSVVGEPPGRSTNFTPRSVRKRSPTRMLPPGAPPSWSSTGSICRYWYAGPPAAWMAATRRVQLVVASTTGLPVPPVTPSLSCTSSIPITSGARRFVTMSDARWSYFACGSVAGEVLDVERREGHFLLLHRVGHLTRVSTGGERRRRERLDLVVREAVVERADDRRGEVVADVHVRHRLRRARERREVAEDLVVDGDPLRVRVRVAAEEDAAPRRPEAGRPRAVVREERDLAEAPRRVDDVTRVDLEEHALEALVEVDGVAARVERAAGLDVPRVVVVDHLGRRHAPAHAEHRRRRNRDCRSTGSRPGRSSS